MADDDHHAVQRSVLEGHRGHRGPSGARTADAVASVSPSAMRVPSPAASTMAESGTAFHSPIVHLLAEFASAFRSARSNGRGSLSYPKPDVLASYVDRLFEDSVIDTLSAYVSIALPVAGLRPELGRQTVRIARAAQLLAEWAKSRPLPSSSVEIVEHEGLTPAIVADVPATPGAEGRLVTLLYGHLDKQPPARQLEGGARPLCRGARGREACTEGGPPMTGTPSSPRSAPSKPWSRPVPHTAACVVLIEASEESGSAHLGPYLEDVGARIGPPGPGLVVCLDSGCVTYEPALEQRPRSAARSSSPSASRCCSEAVHSGLAGGVVPSSFRLLRQLLSRIEDQGDGRDSSFRSASPSRPPAYLAAAQTMAAELGDGALGSFPTVAIGSSCPDGRVPTRLLRRHLGSPPSLVTGVDGVPSVKRRWQCCYDPFTNLEALNSGTSLCRRGTGPPKRWSPGCRRTPPQRAGGVKVEVVNAAKGFDAPPQAEWLVRATGEASEALFGRQAGAMKRRAGRSRSWPSSRPRFPASPVSRHRRARARLPTAQRGRTRCSSL